MLLPELQVLTSKDVTSDTVQTWLASRFPAARVHLGDGAPADTKWSIWLRVEPAGFRDWPCAITLAFTQETAIVGAYPEFELASALAATGVDALLAPRDLVKNLPLDAGWSLVTSGGTWQLADFRGDDAGPRGFAGALKAVTLPEKLGAGVLDFEAL